MRKRLLIGSILFGLLFGSGGILIWNERTNPVSGSGVFGGPHQLILDAGHGGEDGGAVSCTGVPESGINLAIVQKLDQILGFYGTVPILLRDRDISLHDPEAETLRQKKVSDLHNRVRKIEETEGAALISIHQNTFPNPSYHGAQVFYSTGSAGSDGPDGSDLSGRAGRAGLEVDGEEKTGGEVLAARLQDSLRSADPTNQRTPARIPESVYLMNHITCPAALVECGFLSNPTEEARLRSPAYQKALAVCLASGWLQYENPVAQGNGL